MKPIDQMTLPEIVEYMDDMGIDFERWDRPDPIGDICNRLRELHDLTRWIPVSERMPTEEDSHRLKVLWQDQYGNVVHARYDAPLKISSAVAWQRITSPTKDGV
jgi:hypothetical protein